MTHHHSAPQLTLTGRTVKKAIIICKLYFLRKEDL